MTEEEKKGILKALKESWENTETDEKLSFLILGFGGFLLGLFVGFLMGVA